MNHKITRRQGVSSELLNGCDIHPLLKRVYANRNIETPEQIDYTLARLEDYHRLKGIEKAAGIVADAVTAQRKVLVVGDFDADGATSSALVVRALKMFGLESADYLVPNRFEYGYGLTPEIVEVAAGRNPDLIITVDNGISSIEGVRAARAHNMQVVITDHHLPAASLPEADAIVNPNQPGCSFHSKALAGVGVAFYLMLAVRAELRDRHWFEQGVEPMMANLLDLVALGTVADVVPLDANNRVLVEQGLQRIRRGRCCPGIQALLKIAGRDYRKCTSQDFGFYAAPRLNAAGRLDDMSAGIECLLSDDANRAQELAALLDELNQQRKQIEGDMLQQAHSELDEQLRKLEHQPLEAGLTLYNHNWHQGVVGLLASRIKEKFHRPVIAFADADAGADDDRAEIKGSARSIPGLHIRDVLDTIAARHPGLIGKFGGHAMAAGLSLLKKDLDAFSRAFVAEVTSCLSDEDLEKTIESDGGIEQNEMNLATAEALRFGGPWGQHFPEPVFDDEFNVLDWRIVGEKHLKFQLLHNTSGLPIDAIAFNTDPAVLPEGDKGIRAVYRLDVNEFRGRKNLQLIVQHIEQV